jgi:hypothetical protein
MIVEVNYILVYSLLSFNPSLLLVFPDVYLYSFLLSPLLVSALCLLDIASVGLSLCFHAILSLVVFVSLDVMLCLLALASWYIESILDGSSMAHFIFLKTM